MLSIKKTIAKILAALIATETTVTLSSSVTASRSSCKLLKIGNTVYCTLGIDGITNTVTTSTTLFTIPTGYRPASAVTFEGVINTNKVGDFTVSTAGALKQGLTSTLTSCYAAAFWTIS